MNRLATLETPVAFATPLVIEPVDAPAPAAPPKRGGLKKVTFGPIAAKAPETKTAYPVFPDENGQAAIIAARIVRRGEELEALDGALKLDKAELRMAVRGFYFTTNHGKGDVPSSISVPFPADAEHRVDPTAPLAPSGEALVTFQNRYSAVVEDAVAPILGDDIELYFRQSFEIKVEGDKLPDDKVEEILAELTTLFAKFNATAALTVKDQIKPKPDFHTLRHSKLTVAQNLALDEACPIIVMHKTKGRKSKGD